MTIVLVLISPTSRECSCHLVFLSFLTYCGIGGSVKIKSTNPFDAPLIDPNFLTTQVDIQSIREGVRAVLKFVSAPAWSDHVTGRFGDKFIAAVDDASIDEYIRSITTTIFHPASTAMMTKPTDPWGVVNPNFKVKGVNGLRIVDASVFVCFKFNSTPNLRLTMISIQPYQLSCHPQGPIYLLSERASEIIAAGL